MSKEEFLKIQTCDLKVNFQCDGCKRKVKKILKKIEGVSQVSIDAEQGKVTVSGTVAPPSLIKKLAERGKHAEIWGAPKQNQQVNNLFKNMQIDSGKNGKNPAQKAVAAAVEMVRKVVSRRLRVAAEVVVHKWEIVAEMAGKRVRDGGNIPVQINGGVKKGGGGGGGAPGGGQNKNGGGSGGQVKGGGLSPDTNKEVCGSSTVDASVAKFAPCRKSDPIDFKYGLTNGIPILSATTKTISINTCL
ncbi:Heavy metal-associated domain, HMA [Artemisia annua]|uniref:Heavy metal-associated domain, HMA n=1 Tax=Artemisia annua TaxID=35608 RepID=A0A2U1P063_ARTAN|nr:Heavy metal-associated domain, HMA [Artemisia annua]